MKDLREKVFAALNRAKENGYDLTQDDPDIVAADMMTCSDEFDNLRTDEQADLRDYVVEWQESFA